MCTSEDRCADSVAISSDKEGVRKGFDAMVEHSFSLPGRHPKNGTNWRWPAALTSLTVLTVAACTIDTPPPAAPKQISRPTPERPARPHHRPVPRSPPTEPPSDALPEPPPAPADMLAPPSEPSAEEPAQTALAGPSSAELIGLDERRATELLGPAAAVEERAPATVWHYKGARCSLDLIFYMEMRSGGMRTLHAEFKGDAATPDRRQACLKNIVEENLKAPPS